MAEVRMEEVEIKVTWRLVWSLFWRWLLISWAIGLVIWLIILIVGTAVLLPW
jgi:hypothetical protein